jgi:hypothetical protein
MTQPGRPLSYPFRRRRAMPAIGAIVTDFDPEDTHDVEDTHDR